MQQFILIALLLTVLISNVNAQFAGGSGEENNPFQVETLEQLQAIADSVHLDKHFVQMADIDAGETVDWNEGKGFEPIGWLDAEFNEPFTGSYNGNGYAISDLHIDRPITDAVGLFGYIVDAKIENVALLNGAVSGGSRFGGTGGLVGKSNGLVSNSSSSASIMGGINTGGLVGSNLGIIIESNATGAVSVGIAGGLVGENYGEIIDSYATGDVSGSISGGLVGSLSSSSSKITGSYATGDVSGVSRTGGLVGMQGSGDIIGSYAEGNVTGTENEIGGLVGSFEGTIIDSYATGDVTGYSYVGGLAGRQMSSSGRIESSYSTGDITGESYIGGLIGASLGVVIIDSYAEGMISGSSYIGGLAGWSRRSISHSYSTGEISGDSIVGGVAGFNHGDINNSFSSGSVSGKYSIGGLAGENERPITGSYATGPVSGVDYIGGLVGRNIKGYITDSKIEKSFFNGMVSGNNYVGGLTGWNRDHVISSFFAGEVSGDSLVGGLAGWSDHTIRESYSGGKVTGEHVVGGLLGHNQEKGLVSHSYSFSEVEGTSEVGGLIGRNMDEAEVSQTYSFAQVTGSEDTGSLIGVNESTVELSFWNTDLNSLLPVVGNGSSEGMSGLNTEELTGMAAYENLAGFDFGSKWDDIVTDRIWVLTEEYPALHWEDVASFPPPAQNVLITSPANDLENATMPVTFRWSMAEWADRYQFQLFEKDISATPVMDTTVSDRSIVIEQELEYETTYVWRVRSGNDSGFTEWSETFTFTTAASTSAPVDGLPRTFDLLQNYPNPFNPSTHINFSVPEQAHVKLEVYNSLGQRVAILVDEDKNPGRYQVVFDANGLSSGLYMYRFHTPTYTESKQMLLVK